MRKVKLFFLLTALLAIAQGAWAATKTFTSFSKGNNTQSPVTVYCSTASSLGQAVLWPDDVVQISVSAGYTITQVKFTFAIGDISGRPLTATNGTLSNNTVGWKGGTATFYGNANCTQTLLSASGCYGITQIQVTYTAVNYTISYNLGGGSISGSYPTSYNIETNTFTLKNPTRSGYTFTGWTGSNGSTKQTSVSIAKGSTGNKSYTANWQVNQASVTTAPTAKTGLTYNGSAKALVNAGAASNGTMYYRIGTSGSWSTSIPTATNAGTYTVQYYAQGTGGASNSGTGSVQVTIAKANPTVTAPTAKANLTYSGSAQALVNAGSTNGGTMQYKVGSGSWGTSIPTGTNAGSYTVYYKVEGNSNYNGNNGSNFQVTIAKSSTTTIATVPAAVENLEYTGDAQPLATAGSSPDGTMMYSLDGTNWSEDIPTGTAVGDYTVYYYVKGDANHNDGAVQSFNVSIAAPSEFAVSDNTDVTSNLTNLSGETVDLTVNRTIYADGYYNTLCLPFSMTAEQIDASQLAGYETLRTIKSARVSGSGQDLSIDIIVKDETEIVAGMPYLISYPIPMADIVNPVFPGITIETTEPGNVSVNGVTFQGMLSPIHIDAYTSDYREHDYLFLGTENQLAWPVQEDESVKMRGFRAYFIIDRSVISPALAPLGTRARIIMDTAVATDIEQVQNDKVQSTKVLRDGQLFIIKNGVEYNAQGMKVSE